jgi:hypothetical protein
MAQNDIILATKYNTIKAKVDRIITTGSGAEGYGGSSTTSDVIGNTTGSPVPNTISEGEWDKLRADITKCYRHQNGTNPTITDIYQGLPIYWAHAVQYDVLADGIITNKDTIYTGGTTGAYTQQTSLVSGAGTTQLNTWKTSATLTFTVNFGSAENARLFFNLGGQVSLILTHTAGTAGTKSGYWANVIDQIIAAKPTITASNWRNQTNFSGTYDVTSVPYTDNAASVTMQWTTNPATGILVTVTLNDASGQPNAPWGTDELAGIEITGNYEFRCSVGEFTAPVPSIYSAPSWSSS